MESPLHTPRWVIALLAGLFVTAGLAVAAWSVQLPYYAFSAGPVGDAVDSIVVEQGVETFVPGGELMMLTVSLQEVNGYEMVAAAFDPAVDLVRREAIRPSEESDEDFRRRGLDQMDAAKETAISLALARLEVDLPVESDGVRVVDVLPDLPAASFLQPEDLVLKVDGRPVVLAEDIRRALAERSPGDTATLVIERDGRERTFRITLAAAEDDPERALLGILAETINPRLPLDIESSNIGGPSAGLMYTLAIIDLLSEGDLTGGHLVAGTGTIASDGSVGPIGGVRQKVVAAEAAGAEVVLVPAGNYAEALTAPADVEVVSVDSLDQALAYLAGLPPA